MIVYIEKENADLKFENEKIKNKQYVFYPIYAPYSYQHTWIDTTPKVTWSNNSNSVSSCCDGK